MRRVTLRIETWPVRGVFRISRSSQTEIVVVTVEIRDGSFIGVASAAPMPATGNARERNGRHRSYTPGLAGRAGTRTS